MRDPSAMVNDTQEGLIVERAKVSKRKDNELVTGSSVMRRSRLHQPFAHMAC